MKTESKEEMAFLLFEDYETLDVFGPVEIFGRLVDLYKLRLLLLRWWSCEE